MGVVVSASAVGVCVSLWVSQRLSVCVVCVWVCVSVGGAWCGHAVQVSRCACGGVVVCIVLKSLRVYDSVLERV